MALAIWWCVPQCILDVANSVDWPRVSIPADALAEGLRMLASRRKHKLPTVQQRAPKPANVPPLSIAPDIPQEILDVFNDIDWTKIDEPKQYAMAEELSGFVFGPFVNLPRRYWAG